MSIQAIEGYRLSPQQQRLWQLQQMSKNEQAVSLVLVCETPMEENRFKQALHEVISAHEILRTVFQRIEGLKLPVQIIRPDAKAWLPDAEAKGEGSAWRNELIRFYQEFRETPWDLTHGPLIQAQLVKSPVRTAILFRASPLCTDRAGLRNAVGQALRFYTECGQKFAGQQVQYADVSEYLNENLASSQTDPGKEYWARYQSKLRSPLRIPAVDKNDASNIESIRWELDRELFASVESLSCTSGVGFSNILFACWEIVLSRFFDTEEFSIGIVLDGRKLEGLQTIPGPFERTVPVACCIRNSQSFSDLLSNVAQTMKDHFLWQDYFAGDTTTSETTPELPIVLEFEERQPGIAMPHGIFLLREDVNPFSNELKLKCHWSHPPFLEIRFQDAIFRKDDALALQDQLSALLASCTASPSSPLQKLSSLSEKTRELLVCKTNDTASVSYGPDFAFLRFQRQASLHPERCAIKVGDTSVSYRELDEKSSELASMLTARGIGPETGVAVCIGRCPELLVAILGVLKAGGFYIPLDPDYPRERLAFVLRDSKASLLLTQKQCITQFGNLGLPVLTIDIHSTNSRNPVEMSTPKTPLTSANLAYVIYTSGSTGQPKGVMISHKALANYLDWCERNYALQQGNGVVVHSAVGFDLTVTTLLAPLTVGQCVLLISDEESTGLLASMLHRDAELTLIKVTPSHLQALNQLVSANALKGSVSSVIIGGEALHNHHVSLWQREAPKIRLINEYGPTETTVGSSVHEIATGETSGPVPIGKPIQNTQIYLLDDDMQPVPLRQKGEIYIGGQGLARGYLGRSDLTAEKFVPNPFAAEAGDRLYKTGDLARYDSDSTLYFMGRADYQLKLRGYRIELGEIEVALRQHPKVTAAAAIVIEGKQQNRLVAYVETRSASLVSSDLQEFLIGKLPHYMMPEKIVILERLALTSHGKVDRNALPDPDQSSLSEGKFTAPRDAIEKSLAELWARALRIERVGVHDNFFELGGDSIISIQIVNRARQIGLIFTPRQMFYHRTIADLAKMVKLDSNRINVAERNDADRAVATPIQCWFFEQNFSASHHWNQAVLFEAIEQIVAPQLEQALRAAIRHHDALRFRFERGTEIRVSIVPGENGPLLRVLDLSEVPFGRRSHSMEQFAMEVQSGLDIVKGPLTQMGLIRMRDNPDRILWVVHHLAVDVVSWEPLVEDLERAYVQLKNDRNVELRARATSFQQWSLRLLEHAQSHELEQELNYWRQVAARSVPSIPVDFPAGNNLQSSVKIVWACLSIDETRLLVQQVPKAYHAMINDVLLTALLEGYHQWTNQRTLLIDLENHGREELFEDLNILRTVGWFTCVFPVLLELASPYNTSMNLKAVKNQIRSIPNGGIGFGLLRYLSNNPAVRAAMQQQSQSAINFNYLGRSTRNTDKQSMFSHTDGVKGPFYHPDSLRPYLLEVTGAINSKGELRMAFLYNTSLHREESIQTLASSFTESLRRMIRSTAQTDAVQGVDLSLAALDTSDLDKLLREVGRGDHGGE